MKISKIAICDRVMGTLKLLWFVLKFPFEGHNKFLVKVRFKVQVGREEEGIGE